MLQSVILSLLLAAPPSPVTWRTDYAGALAMSQQFDCPLLVVVGRPGCEGCVKLDKATWSDEGVQRFLREKYVALKIDGEKEKELAKQLGVRRYPTLILAAPDGTILSFEEGFVEPAAFMNRLRRAEAFPPAKTHPTWKITRVPCRTVVTAVSRSFRDGSHEHVCPECGTTWRHGGRSGNPVSHVCPGMREVKTLSAEVPVAPASGSWSAGRR